ncbi:hypothetical protein BDV12DRAFT_163894 [Aspergillus spectabilis]
MVIATALALTTLTLIIISTYLKLRKYVKLCILYAQTARENACPYRRPKTDCL